MEKNMVNSQLLITFTSTKDVDEIIKNIKEAYKITFSKIFILQNLLLKKELICSYNINLNETINENYIPQNTIGVHRKKATNTLYTINALNYLISVLNDGKLDSSYQVPWENYQNCILVTNSGEFKKIKTKIFNIIDIGAQE